MNQEQRTPNAAKGGSLQPFFTTKGTNGNGRVGSPLPTVEFRAPELRAGEKGPACCRIRVAGTAGIAKSTKG